MAITVHDYLDYCSLLKGGYFFADMNTISETAYWTAVFLTIGLTILVGTVFANVDDRGSAGRALQLYLALTAVLSALFGIEIPFLLLLLSVGMMILLKKN